MQVNEAIQKLQSIKQAKKQGEDNNQTNIFAKSLMNFKNILVGTIVDTASLVMNNIFSVSVKNFPKGTTINNKKLSVEVTNFPKDKDVQRVEVTNQEKTVFDTTEINTNLKRIELESSKVPPLIKSSIIGHSNEMLSLGKTLDNVLSAVKNIKVSPNITVKPADVKVEAPVVNVKETKIPPFPKKITADVDMSSLEDKIDELITETQYQTSKPIIVANPGDFPVSTTNTRDLAKEAKQLPDNHNVNVSNIDATPLITGFSTSNNQTNGTQVTKIKETLPTDALNTNPTLALGYDGAGLLSTLTKTIGAVQYRKTLTYTSGVLSGVSAWVQL